MCQRITEVCLLYASYLFFFFLTLNSSLYFFFNSLFFYSAASFSLSLSLYVYLSLSQTEMCLASDILCSKLRTVLRCVESLLSRGGGGGGGEELKEEIKAHTPPLSPFSLIPTGFLLFYCLVMGLLCLLYHHLTA